MDNRTSFWYCSTVVAMAVALVCVCKSSQAAFAFTAGDLVVSVEGDGSNTGSYGDNQAAPLTLYQYAINGTSAAAFAGSLELPQTSSGANYAISGEYGSSSEGGLQLSGNGQYLTIMGYGVNADAFNASPGTYSLSSTNTALAQSGSLTGQSYTAVPRVVAEIGADGSVDTSTALYGVFDGNNPRSAYTVDGSSFYVSGQGTSGDATGGVFYAAKGSTSASAITGADAGSGASQDTRTVQVYNGQLYVSTDSKSGATNRDYIGSLGAQGSLPTSVANGGNGPAMLSGFGNTGGTGKVTITTGSATNGNGLNAGKQINLSPENYVFANNGTVLYVADSGSPKNTSATSSVGDGGLQKWSFNGATWTLDYTLASGLGLVANTSTSGTTGLLGLTGTQVTINGIAQEELFATNYTIGDTDQTYLYGITDLLSATTLPTNEQFTQLALAPADSNFKGVAFAPTAAPVPLPESFVLLLSGIGMFGAVAARRSNLPNLA